MGLRAKEPQPARVLGHVKENQNVREAENAMVVELVPVKPHAGPSRTVGSRVGMSSVRHI